MHIRPQIITNVNLNFDTASDFREVSNSEGISWLFRFSNNIQVNVDGGFWRMLQKGKILFTSDDHMQQFGLAEPINLVEKLKSLLSGSSLLKIEVIQETGDLKLRLTNDFTLEILITSSGYESYQFSFDGKRYIGMGSGEIAAYDIS